MATEPILYLQTKTDHEKSLKKVLELRLKTHSFFPQRFCSGGEDLNFYPPTKHPSQLQRLAMTLFLRSFVTRSHSNLCLPISNLQILGIQSDYY